MVDTANKISLLNYDILNAFYDLQKSLKSLNSPNLLEALSDISDQLNHLVYRHYLNDLTSHWLNQYPRFLKAVARRLEKLREDPLADRKKMVQVKSYWQQYKQLDKSRQQSDPARELRWMIEEFRVSLYAQTLKTSMPVSEKRLKEQLKKI